ncbi:MAG: C25 family cysteine peptidase [Candidatus Neomarinimicrobiota bacterium]
MHYYKKLILITIISSFLLSEETQFRGKNKDQLIGSAVPISFVNMITSNYEILPSQLNPQRGSFLIICPDGVAQYMGDFSSFKKSQGFDVEIVTLSDAGSTAENIKSMIGDKLIEDPMLEYVLLIGDVDGFAAFPSFYYGPENDVTDQKFTHITGDDNIPDVFIGRLSIDSLSDLAVIMAKTIQYARDPLAYDSDWLGKGLVVAGNYANTYPIPITPKWTSYWLRDELLSYGYDQVDTVFYPPIQQGASYIIPSIDNGVGIVNYRGWGDANGWHYPEFHVDDVNDLNNGWLTPVFMSYVCNSNDFANNVDPCLAEAIIRGGTPNVPKGGVAFIGPSDLHTSTKYNNVINAYMYDAMLNNGVVELGPAMQAGQSGLIKEFPAQNGIGEAQEFYAHVYNILGDPSLAVYVNTPNQFVLEVDDIYSNDGIIDIIVKDINGVLQNSVIISIMNNDEILSKGITDVNGRLIFRLEDSSLSEIKIYANKSGFVQGLEIVDVQFLDSNISISSLTITDQINNQIPVLGEPFSLSMSLINNTNSSSEEINGQIIFSENVEPNYFDIQIPSLEPGELFSLSDLEMAVYGFDFANSIIGNLDDSEGNNILKVNINCVRPLFISTFVNDGLPNSLFEPSLEVSNYSKGNYSDLYIKLSLISDGGSIIENNNYDLLSSFSSFNTSMETLNYSVEFDNISYGSTVTFLIEFQKNNRTIHSSELPLNMKPINQNFPVSPNNYGYWAYDNMDLDFSQAPVFNWIELDPDYGGSYDNHYELDDDDHVDIELPFTFKYHGIDYEQITISSNGWTSFVPCDIDYFWNMSIPMYMGPKSMLAPFSDDLETIDTDGDGIIDKWINVFTRFDELDGKFIIEWSRALNGYDETTEETFQVILYNHNSMPTETEDGVIDFQYLEIEDVDVTKNYSTVGIEAPLKNYGLQYAFNNVYASGATPLEDGLAIRFSTNSPENYISELSLHDNINPQGFEIEKAYPNPFNPLVNIEINIYNSKSFLIKVYDIMGREINTIRNGLMAPGKYKLTWNGTNSTGNPVSSGTYFIVTQADQKREVKKILFLK